MAVCSGLLYHGRVGLLDPSLVPWEPSMHLATLQHPRPVELRRRVRRRRRRSAPAACPALTSVLDVLRAGALDEVKSVAAGVRADFPLTEVELLPPVPGGEKILCIGVNYANRDAELTRPAATPRPNIPACSSSRRTRFVGAQPADPAAAGIRAARIRGRDRAGDRQDRPPHRRRSARSIMSPASRMCNEGTIRDWIRHGRFNVTQGKAGIRPAAWARG